MTVHARAQATSEAAAAPVRVLQRACACGEAAGVSGKCPACAAEERLGLQPKLTINRPGDRWEREADQIADQVVSDRPPALAGPLPVTPLVQRQEADEDEDEELQRKAAAPAGAGKAAGGAEAAAGALSGGGRPLSAGERAYFEPRFGRDLSAVRIHEGGRAGAAARAIDARAYTLRTSIAFGSGQYAPGTAEGRQLMAHELVHVVQQNDGATPIVMRAGSNDVTLMSITEAWARGRSPDELEEDIYRLRDRLAALSPTAAEYDSVTANLTILEAEVARRTTRQVRAEERGQRSAFESLREVIGEGGRTSVEKPGRIARPEWSLRPSPTTTGEPLRKLGRNESVFVESLVKRPQDRLGWYRVVTQSGEVGWMRSDGVAIDPPEASALIHYVESDEKLIDIAARYYRSEFSGGEDARFYVAAIAYANRDRSGIIFPPGFTDRDWQQRTTWRDIGVKREHAIWIPAAAFMRRLKGLVSSGSITHGLWGKAKAVATFVWNWVQYGAGVIAGILRGALECVYDLFAGVVEMVQAVWSILKSLVTGNIVNDARALWDSIMNLDIAGLAKEFVSNWNNPDPWERGMFRGRVLGYVAVEIALAVFSVGALTVAKWAGRFAGVVRRLASLRKVEDVATAMSRSRRLAELPDPAAAAMRRQFEGGTPVNRREKVAAERSPREVTEGAAQTNLRVDPDVDVMVERGIVEETVTTTKPVSRPRPARPAVRGQAKAAREAFKRVRDGYARRLGVRGGGQVHHAIELQALDRYPGVFRSSELNDFANMRGIATESARRQQLHGSKVREMWDRHYRKLDDQIARRNLQPGTRAYNDYVRRYLEDARGEIDHVLGQFFTEYRSALTWRRSSP